MSVWLIALCAAVVVGAARLLVPPALRGRRLAEEAANRGPTSIVQALVLVTDGLAVAFLVAFAISLLARISQMDLGQLASGFATWMSDLIGVRVSAVQPGDPAMIAIGLSLPAATMIAAVIVTLRPQWAERRLQRQIKALTEAAEAGALPPLPPSAEMQALIASTASLDNDIVALERASKNAGGAELTDLRKMREGLIEDFVEKDLERRVSALRASIPEARLARRSVGPAESALGCFLRDRLLGACRGGSAAVVILSGYALILVASLALSQRAEVTSFADVLRHRVSAVVAEAEAKTLPAGSERTLNASTGRALRAMRTAKLSIGQVSDVGDLSQFQLATLSPSPNERAASETSEIAALTVKLRETEEKLRQAERALKELAAERQRLLEEADQRREAEVATVASQAQFERMAHEAAMAVVAERLRQKEIALEQRTAELKSVQAALQNEKRRLVSLLHERRRQALAIETRRRFYRMVAAAEVEAERQRVAAADAAEAARFRREDARAAALAKAVHEAEFELALSEFGAGGDRSATSAAMEPRAGSVSATRADDVTKPGLQSAVLKSEAAEPSEGDSSGLPAAQSSGQRGVETADVMLSLSPLSRQRCETVRSEARKLGTNDITIDPADDSKGIPLPLETAQALLDCGQAMMKAGDLATARLAFSQVAQAGIAKGALALGTTYDPHALSKIDLDVSGANSKIARFWYRRALVLSSK